MKTRLPSLRRLLHVFALMGIATPLALPAQETTPTPPAETEDAAILESLGDAAVRYVDAFNRVDAAAIAALYTPDGEIVSLDGGILVGRKAIEEFHLEMFAGEVVPKIALEAHDLRLPAPGLAIEEGEFHLTFADDEPVSTITYQAVHIRQEDGTWLLASSRSLADITPPSEQIRPLHWMMGEWTFENEDGLRVDMVIDLDERENNLLGEALVTDALGYAHLSNLKIGWNPATSSIYWWTFDSEGGNAAGPWARRGAEWIVHTTGITADAEATASAQILRRDGDTMVWTATHRVLAGEALPDLTYRFVRRAPDPASLLDAPAEEEE